MTPAHLTQSVSTLGGGISEAVRALSKAQELAGDMPKVLSVKDQGGSISPWPAGAPDLLDSRKFPGMQVIPDLDKALDRSMPDVLHTHGLWSYLSIAVPRWAKTHHCPYIVSPHGMLDVWALNRSWAKKRIASTLYERRHLGRASCLHALCQSEADSIRAYGLDRPVAVIPNGIDLPTASSRESADRNPGKRLLFLGRIHPKKGLENALRAWAKARHGDNQWQFVIAGWDQEEHEAELKRICGDQSIAYADVEMGRYLEQGLDSDRSKASVIFMGPVFGDNKDRLLRSVDAFILPSFSEGLPMSVLEAWAYQLPVLMTDHCNLPEGFSSEAAVRIGTEVASITAGMERMFDAPDAERQRIGENGLALVRERFTWRRIATQMKQLYQWVLGKGDKPDFVHGE